MRKQTETTVAVTENYVENILRSLAVREESHRNEWTQGIEKLTLNAVHNMSWYAKDIYVGQFMQKKYETLAIVINQCKNDIDDNLIPALEEMLEEYDYFLSQTSNLRVKSTCEVSQMTSTWEYECTLISKKLVKGLVKQFKNKTYTNNF